MSTLDKKNILVILTGSIACYKACSIISKLKQQGHHLKVVMSPSSLEFVGKATIEGLTGETPVTDMYSNGNVMDHINLVRWANLILVAPATANYINKIAYGIGDDLLTTLFLAHDFEKPFLLAPAMNTKMYLHPATQDSINRLKKMNVQILETASGVLACGEIGSGRLLEPELVVDEVNKNLSLTAKDVWQKISSPTKKFKVLVTGGGTSEPIDDVRVITNKSTGKTAAQIVDDLVESGLDVTFLRSNAAILNKNKCETFTFETFDDLKNLLTAKLTNHFFDYVIHVAAVSDFSVDKTAGKISSDSDQMQLFLKRNPKLINDIKKISPKTKLIGFKLTSTQDENLIQQKVAALFEFGNCDFVVQNNWSDVQSGQHLYRLYKKNKELDFKSIKSTQFLSYELFQNMMQGQEML